MTPTESGRFARRLTRSPHAFEASRGAEVAELFPELPAEVRSLVKGTAGSSPYLKGLLEKERDWIGPALDAVPEDVFEAILDDVRALPDGELATGLRKAKRRVALLVGLADLAGVWPLETVTGALSRFADLAADRAIAVLTAREMARGKLPGMHPEEAGAGGGMVALAMGKMGAYELNYSSDIDLICLFDDSRFDRDDLLEARAAFVRVARQMAAMLSEVTADGYVFRTDLRLRPDPAVTPVCLSMEAAERYYESVGRTWERAAYIKARAAAGDIKAGEVFLERIAPFVWRRHLDYAAIQDAHDMRLKIREHKLSGSRRALEGLNIKLCPGGIREIEFFTQTRQLIAGGRDPELRLRGTVEALLVLANKGWADEAPRLIEDYRAHRELEHRIQMIADRQTHDLPTSPEEFDRLAALMGRETRELRQEVTERLSRVAWITEDFFAPGTARPSPTLPDASREVVSRWPSYPALRSTRAVEIFERVKPEILSRLDRAAKPEEALVHVDGFLRGLPAGVQLFSLFDANPQLIDLIVDVASTAPALAQYLSRHSEVFDAVIGGGFFADWPGWAGLEHQLSRQLALAPDYEAQLLAARHWRNEWHFRVGVHHLRGLIDAERVGQHYADIASAALHALWTPVVEEFASKHGMPPGRGATVIGMGSLGAEALASTSDLDLIVIYDPAGAETSEGPRPLDVRTYYARLTKSFLTAFTAPMGPGQLYEVDMRLRPSGRKGPVATSLASFKSYQRDEAWTWEHLALTRARAVAGSTELGDEVEAFRRSLLAAPSDRRAVLGDVAAMRARLDRAKPGEGIWDAKSGPGRLQDIALLAETGALLAGSPERDPLLQICEGRQALGLSKPSAQALMETHRLFWRLQAAERLLVANSFDPDQIGEGGRLFLLRETCSTDMSQLASRLEQQAAEAAAIISEHLPDAGTGNGTAGNG